MIIQRVRALALAFLLMVGAGSALLTTSSAAGAAASGCTHTSSGSCIRGGEFCPQAKYGQVGTDADGRHYKCSGSKSHPRWEKTSSAKKSKHVYHGHTLSVGDGYAPDGRYKPRTTNLSGDGTLDMYKSHWSRWTKKQARGRGIGHFDNCIPNCAYGHISKIKMHLVESRPRNYCGKRYFTHYHVTFARKPTKHTPKSYTLVREDITCG